VRNPDEISFKKGTRVRWRSGSYQLSGSGHRATRRGVVLEDTEPGDSVLVSWDGGKPDDGFGFRDWATPDEIVEVDSIEQLGDLAR
jgi:hypothetical protein